MVGGLALGGALAAIAGTWWSRRRRPVWAAAVAVGLAVAAWWPAVPAQAWWAGAAMGMGAAVLAPRSGRARPLVLAGLGVGCGVLAYAAGWPPVATVAAGWAVVRGREWGGRRFLWPSRRGPLPPSGYRIHALFCGGPACRRAGGDWLWETSGAAAAWTPGAGVRRTRTACLGYCAEAPVVWFEPHGVLWRRVTAAHLLQGPPG